MPQTKSVKSPKFIIITPNGQQTAALMINPTVVQAPAAKPAHRFMSKIPTSLPVAIHPDEAKLILLHWNTKNRKINLSGVELLVDELKKNRWKLTSQGIGFDINGVLIDGQHRLEACVASGIPLLVVAVYGLEPSSQQVIDSNSVRSHYQQLVLSDYPTLTKVQYQIAYNLARYGMGRIYGRVPRSEIEQYLTSKKDLLIYIASKVSSESTPKQFKRVNFLTAIAEYVEKSPVKAKAFFEQVVHPTGANIGAHAGVLRMYLTTSGGSHSAVQGTEDYWKTVSAINKYHNDEPMTKQLHQTSSWAV